MQKKYYFILIGLVVLGVGILTMPKEEYCADPMAVRCETVSLINNGSLSIPAEIAASYGERGQFFVENVAKGTWYCKYGIFNGLMYLPILSLQKWMEGKLEYFSPSRVIYLNCFNLLLSLASAFYLFLIANRYTDQRAIAFLYVIAALYTTYWWNYLRAQNSEIYQTFFMLGFYYHLVRSWSQNGDGLQSRQPQILESVLKADKIDAVSGRRSSVSQSISNTRGDEHWSNAAMPNFRPFQDSLLAGLFFAALILTKVMYVILLPIIGIFFILSSLKQHPRCSLLQRGRLLLPSICSFGMPIVVALGVIFAVNNYKFGSPFESGYGQWQERGEPIFSGHLFSALSHFFFDPQFSMFLCFPLFLFALFGYSSFVKKFRREASLFIAIGITILLVNSKLLTWSGKWCYGPRYLLVMLPLVSLPFLTLMDDWKKKKRWVVGAIITLMLLFSLKLQMNVNALPFFVYFRLQGALASLHDPQIDHYFSKKPFGLINQDFLVFKNRGKPLAFLEPIEERMSPEMIQRLHQFFLSELRSNYYWEK